MRILVIEDNRRLAAAIAQGLAERGWTADPVHDGAEGLARALDQRHDVIILDLMLPSLDGTSLLRRLRAHGVLTPVLVLTARDALEDRVAGLDLGADDYLVKPFAFDELVARLRAVVRRQHNAAANVITVADLEVDTAARTVRRGGAPIALSAREYAVLEFLVQRRGRTVTREQLIDALYEPGDAPGSNVVDVFVAHLRRKIDGDHARKLIHTRRGLGYLVDEVE